MAYTNIDLPTEYFEAKTYTGTGSTQSITGLEFSPDFVWIKNRSGANSHGLVTSLVDTKYALDTSATSAEVDFSTSGVTSLNSDGFTVVSHPVFNGSGNNYISWNWDANGAGVSNTDGTITSTVSANTTAGFSIVSYTGNGTVGATVGHGLGVTPAMVIVKSRSTAQNWPVKILPFMTGGQRLELNSTGAISSESAGAGSLWNATNPNSTVITLGDQAMTNTNGTTYISYCWSQVKGFSKFGSYTGNGSTDGTFIYTGFKPAFIMIKQTGSGGNWLIQNNKMQGFNKNNDELYANLADSAYVGTDRTDLLSNGFKARINSGENNSSGVTYIYMAFAENPFVSSKGIPTTAR